MHSNTQKYNNTIKTKIYKTLKDLNESEEWVGQTGSEKIPIVINTCFICLKVCTTQERCALTFRDGQKYLQSTLQHHP